MLYTNKLNLWDRGLFLPLIRQGWAANSLWMCSYYMEITKHCSTLYYLVALKIGRYLRMNGTQVLVDDFVSKSIRMFGIDWGIISLCFLSKCKISQWRVVSIIEGLFAAFLQYPWASIYSTKVVQFFCIILQFGGLKMQSHF